MTAGMMMGTPDPIISSQSARHARVSELFVQASRLPRDDQARLFESIEDQCVRAELESLLKANARIENFLDEPLAPQALRVTKLDEAAIFSHLPTTPLRISGYRLLEKLGEGGMAEVWRAEQLEPVRREVALKLLRPGLESREIVRRFHAERQALAMLDHPSIVRLISAGMSDDGRPYFIMEHVRGGWITHYCREHQLNVRARLELMVTACRAVHHAHQRGITHRDLKPSNVLIAAHDGTPAPKIIDFGVAKIIHGRAAGMTTHAPFATTPGSLIGTLEYMAPEQVRGPATAIDTRTDVYALGTILYELLAGAPPHDLRNLSLPEASRVVAERQPRRLGEIDRAFKGELETIVRRAMEPEIDQRYPSANDLAEDLERYLNDEPILAQPPTTLYLIRKFAVKHRALVASAAVLAVAFLSLLSIAMIAWRQSERRQQTAIAAVDFLLREVIENLSTTAGAAPVREAAMRRVLNETESLLRERHDDHKLQLLYAEALGWLAEFDREQGRISSAETSLGQALAIHERLVALDPSNEEFQVQLSINFVKLGDLAKDQSQYELALPWYQRALEIDEALASLPNVGHRYEDNLCWSYERMGDLASRLGDQEATHLWHAKRFALAQRLAQRKPDSPSTLFNLYAAHTYMAFSCNDAGDIAGYEQHAREALRYMLRLEAIEPDNRRYQVVLATAMLTMATIDEQCGRHEEAWTMRQRALAIHQRLNEIEPEFIDAAWGYMHACDAVAAGYEQRGEFAKARTLRRTALEVAERVRNKVPAHPWNSKWAQQLSRYDDGVDR